MVRFIRSIATLFLAPALAVGSLSPLLGSASVPSETQAQAAAVVQAGIHENDSGAISFTGSWSKTKDTSGDSGRNSHNAEGAGDSATIRFEGDRVQYIARKNPWLGIAAVYIDGELVQRIDLYSPSSQFSQIVLDRSGLSSGVHEMRIVREGQKNPASTTKNINVDAIRVFDSVAPAQVKGVQVEVLPTGARVSWAASSEPDLSHYEVFRGDGSTGSFSYIERLDRSVTSMLDTGLVPGASYRWTVIAVDTSGNRSNRAAAIPGNAPARNVFSPKLADCPSTTKTVANAAQLKSALQSAAAGDVIRLSPGTYSGAFSLSVNGTPQQPVWVCGPRTAVIDNGTTTSGYGLHIYDSASVRAVGFTVQNVRKGVSVSTGSDIVVSDLSVRNIGEEAIHLRYDTTDSVVSNNSISYTGLTGPLYGEGVYVGTDPKNWCKFTDCRPDRSDRNAVYGNTIWGTPVEGIEAKAGTSNGLIADNVVNGTSTRDQYSGISVKGNEWVIEDNRVTGVRTRAISVQDSSSEGWGYDSVLSRNTVSSDSDGVGIWATARLRNIVSCDNVNTTQGAALSNLACQK